MKIRKQDGEWWKFEDDGEGINQVKIIDIDNRPLTNEILQELGFKKECVGCYQYNISSSYAGKLLLHINLGHKKPLMFLYLEHTFSDSDEPIQIAVYDTVGSVKFLLEALKGDL